MQVRSVVARGGSGPHRRSEVRSASATEGLDGKSNGSSTPPTFTSGNSGSLLNLPSANESDSLKEQVRIEQELESDRRFFADPPEDFVRCPLCNVIYAVQNSRPATPSDYNCAVQPSLPASYSKDLPRGANLNLDEAMRHLHRSRFRCAQCDTDFCRCGVSPYHWGWSCEAWEKHQQVVEQGSSNGLCRWCDQPCEEKHRRCESLSVGCCGSDEGTDLKRFPPALSCVEKSRRACGRRHFCGHWCGGVRGEDKCLPCLHADCRRKASKTTPEPPVASSSMTLLGGSSASSSSSADIPLSDVPTLTPAAAEKLPDSEDWCPICWTEPLGAAPAIQLNCGHVLHQHCAEAMIKKGHTGGRRLTFKSIKCPLCQAVMQHSALQTVIGPQLALYHKVRRKALQRWVVEQRRPMFTLGVPGEEDKLATLAMQKMTFFECSQCTEPYYGGEVECAGVEEEEDLDEDVQAALAMELVCRGCASKGQLQCPEHGTDFLGWKCRYCCEREAHYFCFGTTHFCHACHDLWQTGVDQRRKLQAGKPCLGKDRCIFGGRHPVGARNGRDEYALGCTICAQDSDCALPHTSREKRVARRNLPKKCVLM